MHILIYSKNANFLIILLVPPEWISRPKDLESVEGEDVFFPCRVSGVPEPMVTWRKLAGNMSYINVVLFAQSG